MIGRAAYHNPYLLVEADAAIYGDRGELPSRADVVRALLPFLEQQCSDGVPLKVMCRHFIGLYQGMPGAKHWRRALSDVSLVKNAGPEWVEQAQLTIESIQQDRDLS
jgi:tRNA-dihydrouridine synthase A